MTNLRVLIVGCGNIAGAFDSGRDRSRENPLTHAGAYLRDGRFNLAACVDPDESRRQAFIAEWDIPLGFKSIDEVARSPERFDVVSVCSPAESHDRDLEVALALEPRLIFCEKPVTGSLARTRELVGQCARAGIPLAVNYTRRWDPAIADLRQGIEEGRWGRLRSAVGYYNKGLLNNGSHMLDLLHLLFGNLSVVGVGRPFDDFRAADPTVPVWLETGKGMPIQLACGHAADFSLFELQLIFERSVVTMEEGGMFWRERAAVDDSTFRGYRTPGEGVRRAGGYPQAMLQAIDNIFGAINHSRPLASTGDSALETQRLCERIRQP